MAEKKNKKTTNSKNGKSGGGATAKKNNIKQQSSFTLAVAIVLVVVAVIYYLSSSKEQQPVATEINAIFCETSVAQTDLLTMHFIDVGQGDCIFIQFPDGKNMLIDGGSSSYGGVKNTTKITNYIKGLGVDRITVLLATHAHEDHIGSLPEIYENFEVQFSFRPSVYYIDNNYGYSFSEQFNLAQNATKYQNCHTKIYGRYLQAIADENCGWEYFTDCSDFTQLFEFGENTYKYSMDFLSPTSPSGKIGYSDANNYSPIIELSYCGFTAVLTGDAEVEVEKEVMKKNSLKHADLLKVGHHGSDTSSGKEFLEALTPTYSVIMVGEGNTYKHPCQQTLDNLYDLGSCVYRTDLSGNIVVTVSSVGNVNFKCEKTADPSAVYVGRDV